MLSAQAIADISAEMTKKAKQENREPWTYWDAKEVLALSQFPFPALGDYVPEGWEKIDDLFCDKSGFGRDDEPALSVKQLKAKIIRLMDEHEKVGFAITEEGEFQVYVGVYIPA